MISFIIIGRNEGWKLSKCFESVFNTISTNQLKDYEIIYLDSKSTDDSLVRVKQFENVKAFQLTADFNAAIARNIGVQESKGDILYFIDGDMEINPSFLPLVYNKTSGLKYKFVSGQYVNYFYNEKDEFLYKDSYDKSIESGDKYKVVTGGLFIISREYWNLINGMRIKYTRSQDIDFGLRLARRGIKLLRKKESMAIHHTISYRNNKRMWRMLFEKSELYGKSMLYRDHFFNKNIYPIIARNDYSLIILILSVLTSIILLNPLFLLLYALIVVLRSIKAAKFKMLRLWSFLAYFSIRDIIVFLGLFFFFPKKEFVVKYDEK